MPTPLRRPRPTAEPAPPGVAPGVVAGAGRRADDARPPDAHEAVESLLQSLLSRERRLEGAAGELPRASERAARRILEAAQRLSERTRPAAPVRRETLASGTADGGAPRDGGTTLRWSKTYREARRLADELVQLLRSSQARRAPPPAVRRSEEPVAAGDAAAAESRDDKRDRKPDVERALATILRDVTTEIRHRDLTWLSEDPYG